MPLALKQPAPVNPTVEQLLLLLPDPTFGARVHQVYVNRLEGALPGTPTQPFDPRRSFRAVFYPDWEAEALYGQVSGATGLSDEWWSNFSVAVLCQSMANLTTRLRPQLLQPAIDAAVSAANAELRTRSARVYALALSRHYLPFKVLFDGVEDRSVTRAQYRQALLDNVGVYRIWYSAGQWRNPDWELFNHLAKLLALGATDADIDTLITDLDDAGLPIPPAVTVQTWRSYSVYLDDHPNVDHADVDGDARGAILAATPAGSFPGVNFAMDEGNSFEFTASGQPGNRFRAPPSTGSCFTANARVLLAGGASAAIGEVRPGTQVATPRGPRAVAFVSTPLLQGRTLYALNGMDFGFTATHPFASADPGPAFLCVSPADARRLVPTFAQAGVGALLPGTRVLQPAGTDPAAPEPVPVAAVDVYPAADPPGPYLYDLVLQPDEQGIPPYWVGDGTRYVLVAPELPLPLAAPYAAAALLNALGTAIPALTGVVSGPPPRGARRAARSATDAELVVAGVEESAALGEGAAGVMFARLAEFGVTGAAGALPGAALRVKGLGAGAGGVAVEGRPRVARALRAGEAATRATAPIEQVRGFVAGMGGLNGMANVVFGAAFETLSARLVDEVAMAVELGWRAFQPQAGPVPALSLGGLLLDEPLVLPPGAQLRAEVQLVTGGVVRETHTVFGGTGRSGTAFAHYFDRVVYFSTTAAQAAGGRVDVTVYQPGARIPLLAASAFFPDVLDPYRRMVAPVEGGDGVAKGTLEMDLRCLTPPAVSRERARAPLWTTDDRARYAQALGPALAQDLAVATRPPSGV